MKLMTKGKLIKMTRDELLDAIYEETLDKDTDLSGWIKPYTINDLFNELKKNIDAGFGDVKVVIAKENELDIQAAVTGFLLNSKTTDFFIIYPATPTAIKHMAYCEALKDYKQN